MLKRKTIELLEDFDKFTENNRQYSCKIKTGILNIMVCRKIDDYTNPILHVYIYSRTDEYIDQDGFDYSEEGFIAACEWIDEVREKVIGDLL